MRTIATLVVPIVVAACGPQHPDVTLSPGHPADPSSAQGQVLGAPPSLRPEVSKAKPKLSSATPRQQSQLSPTARRTVRAGKAQ